MPDRTFHDGSENPGASINGGRCQIDDAAKDPHKARVNGSAIKVGIGMIRMMSHRYSPLLTELSEREGLVVPPGI